MPSPASLLTRHPAFNWIAATVLTALSLWGFLGEHSRWFEGDPRDPSPEQMAYGLLQAKSVQTQGEFLLVLESTDFFTESSITALTALKVEFGNSLDGLDWLQPSLETLEPGIPSNSRELERIFSPDRKTLVLPVQGIHGDASELSDQVRSMAAKALQGSGIRFRLTGTVPLRTAMEEALDDDRIRFMTIGYLLTLIMAIVLFRNYRAVLIGMVTPGMAVFWALGFLRLMGEKLNALSEAVMPIMLTMIAFAEVVHLLVHFRHLRQDGEAQSDALFKTVRQLGLPCFLAALTTGIGFASLMLAETPFIQDFGRACTVGVVSSFLAVILLVPALCASPLGRRIHLGAEKDIIHRKLSGSNHFIDFVIAKAPWIAAGGFLLMIALGILAFTSLRPDHRMAWRLPTGSEAYQGMAHIDETLGGFQEIHIIVTAPPDQSEEASGRLLESVQSILDDEDRVKHATPSQWTSGEAHPEGTNPEKHARGTPVKLAEISARVTDEGLAAYEPVFDRIREKLSVLERQHRNTRLLLTGLPVIQGADLHLMITDLLKSLGAATGLIFLTMTLVYRSLRIGLLSMIPNLLPLTVSAAILVVLGRGLEMAAVCSFTICLGIAVDDTIHFLSRYRFEKARAGAGAGASNGDASHIAIRKSFQSVGTALIVTTVVMVSGFATVMLSDLPSHRSFGLMACGTLLTALVADLIILPALICLFRRKEEKKGPPAP